MRRGEEPDEWGGELEPATGCTGADRRGAQGGGRRGDVQAQAQPPGRVEARCSQPAGSGSRRGVKRGTGGADATRRRMRAKVRLAEPHAAGEALRRSGTVGGEAAGVREPTPNRVHGDGSGGS
ncbi:hypothetical protein ZWY2020_049742 [Hordeum vulgare]|nr:hypothetical protein ZWY2020_049742 [Hordeum vulgare]